METLADIAKRVEEEEDTLYVFITTTINRDGSRHMGEIHTNVVEDKLVIDMLKQLTHQLETNTTVVFGDGGIPTVQ